MVNLQSLQNEYLKGKIIQSRLINDTIYNHIQYTKLEDKILQTKILNRLQFVTQNALAYFSYPSITTKRFIHSLGTMHLSSYIFKNALLNANRDTKNSFLKDLKNVVKSIIKEEKLNINLDGLAYFDNKALYEFTIPTKNKKDRVIYTIILQTIRIVGLLHDVGHLPFSHQVEYALKKIYYSIKEKDTLLDEELEFDEKLTEKQLAHQVKDPLGRAYNRTAHIKLRREMMQKWADYLFDEMEKYEVEKGIREARQPGDEPPEFEYSFY